MCVDKYSPLQMTNDLTKYSEILTKHVNRRCLSLFIVLINVHLFLLHYLLHVYISLSAEDLTTSLCQHHDAAMQISNGGRCKQQQQQQQHVKSCKIRLSDVCERWKRYVLS